jgi:hypothetical protein
MRERRCRPAGAEIKPEDAKSFKGMPSASDSMVIKAGAGQEFELQVAANPMTLGTFDESSHAHLHCGTPVAE